MATGQKKPEAQWTANERKAANLDQRLKSLIMSVLPDDQMNSVINCLSAKSMWDGMILYHEGPSDVKESRVIDLKLCYNTFKFKEEEVSSDDEETKVKALITFTNEERISVGKESARNGEWTKITIKKVHTLLEIKDNDNRKSFLDYLCIDLNYVKEQINNLLSKYKNLVQELNTYKEQLLVLKQAKLDLLTMQHVNTKILKENQNLKLELKELTSITKTWLNISNKVNQCINEQIPTKKKKILGIGQLTEDTSSFGSKDLVLIKSLAHNLDMSITSSNLHKSSEAEDSILPNHNTDEVLSNKSQRNITDPLAIISDSSASDYDSADESLLCSTPLLPLKMLDGAEPSFGPKTVKSILKSKSTFKAKTLPSITLNEPSSTPSSGNKSSLASKTIQLLLALKPHQPKESPFIDHTQAICALDKPMVFKTPKTSSRAESVSHDAKLRAKTGHKKPTTSKQLSVSSKEATKDGSSK
nr:hypothetical protein [Tanacetum cinerariifolium]